MTAIFSLRNIEVLLGKSFCLTIPQLDFEAGKIHVITGSNGAGKSTLLRTLALLIAPQRGTLSFLGEEIAPAAGNLLQQRQKITLVEQSPYLLRGTVFSNLAFGLKLRGVQREEQQQRISKALDDVGLQNFSRRRVKELSGGEIQRVALARALVLKPQALLLDEPTANIDSSSLSVFEELLVDLPDIGITVIMSTHNDTQTERLGGHEVKLEEGKILRENPLLSV